MLAGIGSSSSNQNNLTSPADQSSTASQPSSSPQPGSASQQPSSASPADGNKQAEQVVKAHEDSQGAPSANAQPKSNAQPSQTQSSAAPNSAPASQQPGSASPTDGNKPPQQGPKVQEDSKGSAANSQPSATQQPPAQTQPPSSAHPVSASQAAPSDSPIDGNKQTPPQTQPNATITYEDEKLRVISDARRKESPSYNAYLSGFEGPNSPRLTVKFGPTKNDPDGSPTNAVTSTEIAPPLSTCSSATDCKTTSPAILKSATITVNDKIANDPDQVSETLAHEGYHGHDARTDPERFRNEPIKDENGKVIPHDARPVERRAIDAANDSQREIKNFKKEHKEEYKQIEKEKKDALKKLQDGSN